MALISRARGRAERRAPPAGRPAIRPTRCRRLGSGRPTSQLRLSGIRFGANAGARAFGANDRSCGRGPSWGSSRHAPHCSQPTETNLPPSLLHLSRRRTLPLCAYSPQILHHPDWHAGPLDHIHGLAPKHSIAVHVRGCDEEVGMAPIGGELQALANRPTATARAARRILAELWAGAPPIFFLRN